MVYVIAIDPGNILSGYAILDISGGFPGKICQFGKLSEIGIKQDIMDFFFPLDDTNSTIYFTIEMIANYGMPAGQTVFDTCAVIGRFEEYFNRKLRLSWISNDAPAVKSYRVYRKKVSPEGISSTTMALCKTTRAKDSNIRQAIIDLYPAIGGGKIPQIGNKKEPGPLYGVTYDAWSALSVGLTFQVWLEKSF